MVSCDGIFTSIYKERDGLLFYYYYSSATTTEAVRCEYYTTAYKQYRILQPTVVVVGAGSSSITVHRYKKQRCVRYNKIEKYKLLFIDNILIFKWD